MAENINDGGRAFPVHPGSNPDGGSAGMSLRDWFAGQIIGSVVVISGAGQHDPGAVHLPEGNSLEAKLAADAYAVADAMLAARSR